MVKIDEFKKILSILEFVNRDKGESDNSFFEKVGKFCGRSRSTLQNVYAAKVGITSNNPEEIYEKYKQILAEIEQRRRNKRDHEEKKRANTTEC